MKQKWPILIFSALLTAFIVLAGIWGNAQFEHLHSGSVLTAQHAAQGIALDGWRQEAPGQWHFTFTVGEDIPSLTLCVTNTAAPLAHEGLTSLERSGELYALDVAPGETVELVFTCSRSPQTWLMTSAFASRAFRFRTMTQLIALTAFVTMGMVLLALYHYKHLPELGYFLLYLVIMSVWALMVFFFPAIRNSLLQRILRSFFSLTVLASALLAAGLLLWPYHGEILMYSNQCGVGFGYLLCALALALALPHLLCGWQNSLPGACGAVVCLCFALGLYESFAPVWLTLLCAALLLDAAAAEPHSRKAGKIWGSILRGLWPLAAALVLRKGLTALLCAANGVSGQDGTASKTIFWFQRDSVRAAVVIPVREWLTNYLARAFGIPALALLALASWAVVLWVLRHRGGNGRALFAAGLIVSQFSLGILQGTGAQMARAVQCFAVFVPFAAWLWLAPALDRGKQGGAKAIICAALAGAMLAVELISLTGTIRYNRDRWQYEERLLIKTADELNDLDPAGTLPVAFVGQAELSPELQDRLVIPAANPAYKAAYLIYTVLGGPLGDLDRYENPQTMVINWAQDAFGGKEQIALLMQQVGRPCALADADQQDAADTLAEAGEAPVGVSLQDGYLLVNFTGWTAE